MRKYAQRQCVVRVVAASAEILVDSIHQFLSRGSLPPLTLEPRLVTRN
jgi:hypothetical protein